MNRVPALKQYFAQGRILVSVGVYDALTALIAEREGAPSIYVTGFGAAAARLGAPDIGLVEMSEMVEHIRAIAGVVECPVIADADTGYGGPANVRRTVREYEAAGVDVIQLEDQEWPKRCGHMEGKRLVPPEEMVQRIATAVDSRRANCLILARTDAIAVEGFEAAIARAHTYADAGADLIFVEAPQNEGQLAQIPRLLNRPCLANMVEGGKTPFRSVSELQAMGYAIALFPISTLFAAAHAVRRTVAALLRDGTTNAVRDSMFDFAQFNDLIGLSGYAALIGGKSNSLQGGGG